MQGNLFYMLAATLTTAICWGVYGPVLHWGQEAMAKGRLRTFICVGVAYFVVAIVFPILLMYVAKWETEDKFQFTTKGMFWSFMGGAMGAIGALGIILAFRFSPFQPSTTPLVVMPLVFGLAPVVNTMFQMTVNKTWDQINPFFAAGLILAAVGASTVLIFAPKPSKPHGAPAKPDQVESKSPDAKPLVEKKPDDKPTVETKIEEKSSSESTSEKNN